MILIITLINKRRTITLLKCLYSFQSLSPSISYCLVFGGFKLWTAGECTCMLDPELRGLRKGNQNRSANSIRAGKMADQNPTPWLADRVCHESMRHCLHPPIDLILKTFIRISSEGILQPQQLSRFRLKSLFFSAIPHLAFFP